MRRLLTAFVLAAAVATAASSTHASIVTSDAGPLCGGGSNSSAIAAFADVGDTGDTSELVLTGFGGNPIFNISTDAPADAVDLGPLSDPQVFGLNNLVAASSFLANVAGGDPVGTTATFVGVENWRTPHRGSDIDHNDLIFASSNLPVTVPEPMSLGLIGVGLVGIAFVRRRRLVRCA